MARWKTRQSLMVMACLSGLVVMASAQAVQSVQGGLQVRYSRSTGLVRALAAPRGQTIPLTATRSNNKTPAALFDRYGALFGIKDQKRQLRQLKQHTDLLGYTHTTFSQVHRGITVFGGQLKVHQNPAGDFVAANGDFYVIPDKLNTTPGITQQHAAAVAGVMAAAPHAALESGELVIVDPGWYGDPPTGPQLAWHIILTDGAGSVRVAFFIDAHHGRLLDRWNLLTTAREREVYDAQGGFELPGELARSEGDPPTGDADIDAAYDYAGDVYDYFDRAFQRDGLDDNGAPLILTAHFDAPFCPNAFWNGTQMVFCDGTATDDITGHEIMHGVTQFTANLIYQNQSGQLNESYSDIFGELIDLFNGDVAFSGPPSGPEWPTHDTGPGLDTPNDVRSECTFAPEYEDGVRWLITEDATGFDGAIRDMWEPTCAGDPDRANSPLADCFIFDNGGVHSGSGVPNHAFAIMVDGKEFNDFEVEGIGPIKAGAVWYRALTTYLTPLSDFEDAYWALTRSAADLEDTEPRDPRTGAPGDDISGQDVAQVDLALRAVEMNTAGRCGATPLMLSGVAPNVCASQAPWFFEDFEGDLDDWHLSVDGNPDTDYDWIEVDTLPGGRSGQAAYCADLQSPCQDEDEAAVHHLTSPSIEVPEDVAFPMLSFTHHFGSEIGWDGGTVWIRVGSDDYSQLPPAAFEHNGYSRLLQSEAQDNTNPHAGRAAFTGTSGVWGTSVVSLAGFASGGDNIRVRFDFSKDRCNGGAGWYIDDVLLYDCPLSEDCDRNGVPDELEDTTAPQLTHNASDHGNLFFSDEDGNPLTVWAQRFHIVEPQTIGVVRVWGAYLPDDTPEDTPFTIIFHEAGNGAPGDAVTTHESLLPQRQPTGLFTNGSQEYELTFTLEDGPALEPGTYWIEFYADTGGDGDSFGWVTSRYDATDINAVFAQEAPGQAWNFSPFVMSLQLLAVVTDDCDGNGQSDGCNFGTAFSTTSAPLSPIGDGFPQQYSIAAPPVAASDVTVGVRVFGDFSSDLETLELSLNDSEIGEVLADAADCPDTPSEDAVVIPADMFNALVGDGPAVFTAVATDSVGEDTCDDPSFIQFLISYDQPDLDCNDNLQLDVCDIADGTSPDRNDNGIPDECEDTLTVLSSTPPDGAIDARQPTDGTGQNLGWDAIIVAFNADAAAVSVADFELISSGPAPQISAIDIDGDHVVVAFDGPIVPGECSTLTYTPNAHDINLGYLPADVNGDGTSGPLDILAVIDELNGVADPPLNAWQCDVDRSASCEPLDILKVIDLLNGAGAFDVWNGRELPACP